MPRSELSRKYQNSVKWKDNQSQAIQIDLTNLAQKQLYPKTYAAAEGISENTFNAWSSIPHTDQGYQVRRLGPKTFLMGNCDAKT